MKKNLIALSVAAMVGGMTLTGAVRADVIDAEATSTFMEFSPDGVGHALVVPYYSVQGGNKTVFHVVNTDTFRGKAVKVRFRGASNSDDVFDFQVFMSPGDVFTGEVVMGANGAAEFRTSDNSCTIPAVLNGESFVLSRLSAEEQVDGLGSREGYIEIFNMADIPRYESLAAAAAANEPGNGLTYAANVNDDKAADADADDENILWTAIKHVDGVAPCGLTTAGSRIRTLLSTNTSEAATEVDPGAGFQAGTSVTSAHVKGLDYPTASLLGTYYIVNVADATSYSANASSIRADGTGNIVYWPQRDFPVVGQTDQANDSNAVHVFSADPLLKLGNTSQGRAVGGVQPRAYDLPDMSTPYTPTAKDRPWFQAFNLSALMATSSVTNQFATDVALEGKSDWVFSMPSRRYNAAVRYSNGTKGTGAPAAIYTDLLDGQYSDNSAPSSGDGLVPYTELEVADTFYQVDWNLVATDVANTADQYDNTNNFFTGTNTRIAGSGEQLCVSNISPAWFNREEQGQQGADFDFVISPSTPEAVAQLLFCGETSVLKFNVDAADPSVLGASLATQGLQMTTAEGGSAVFENGWASLATPGLVSKGLPILGTWFFRAISLTVEADKVATFGLSHPHTVSHTFDLTAAP